MTPTTRLPLVAALLRIADEHECPSNWATSLEEAAALIEKQGAQIEALERERVSLIETKREQLAQMQQRIASLPKALFGIQACYDALEGAWELGTADDVMRGFDTLSFAILSAKTLGDK